MRLKKCYYIHGLLSEYQNAYIILLIFKTQTNKKQQLKPLIVKGFTYPTFWVI